MNRTSSSLLFAAARSAAATPLPCFAAVLVGNLDQPRRDGTGIPTVLGWAAQSFVTGASGELLSAIDVLVGQRDGSTAIVAELRADSAFGPGALLSGFSVPLLPAGTPQPVSLTPSIAWALAPDTTYWLVLGTTGAGSFGWSYAQGNVTTGPGSLASYAYSQDQGVSWNSFGTDNPYQMQVDVSAVPEPATAQALLLGLLCVGGLKYWLRRAAADGSSAMGK